MKRIVISILSLTGLVGGSSAGLYYAHDKFMAAAPETAEPEMAPPPRDLRPTPIPLTTAEENEPAPRSNPFVRPASTTRVVAEERYPEKRTAYDAAAAADEQAGDAPQTIDRDDASPPAANSGDPLGLRDRQQAADSEPADEPRELAPIETPDDRQASAGEDEPRTLRETPAAQEVDRYGRPLPAASERSAPADEPREEVRSNAQPAGRPRFDAAPQREEPQAAETPTEVTPTEEGTGRPGDPKLSGTQAPTLTIEKLAPAEIQIGKPAKFLIKVTNAGSVVAQGVEVHDTVPQGTQLMETSPTAKRGPRGALVWELGALKPGDEQTVELQLMPTAEGEIGSVATVHFTAQASVRTLSTKPMLSMERHCAGTRPQGTTGHSENQTVKSRHRRGHGHHAQRKRARYSRSRVGQRIGIRRRHAKTGRNPRAATGARGRGRRRGRQRRHRPGRRQSAGRGACRDRSRRAAASSGDDRSQAAVLGAECHAHDLHLESRHGDGQGNRVGGRAAQGIEIHRSQQRRPVRRGNP